MNVYPMDPLQCMGCSSHLQPAKLLLGPSLSLLPPLRVVLLPCPSPHGSKALEDGCGGSPDRRRRSDSGRGARRRRRRGSR